MCIIVYKSATAKFPEKKVLKTCFDNNDDGSVDAILAEMTAAQDAANAAAAG